MNFKYLLEINLILDDIVIKQIISTQLWIILINRFLKVV